MPPKSKKQRITRPFSSSSSSARAQVLHHANLVMCILENLNPWEIAQAARTCKLFHSVRLQHLKLWSVCDLRHKKFNVPKGWEFLPSSQCLWLTNLARRLEPVCKTLVWHKDVAQTRLVSSDIMLKSWPKLELMSFDVDCQWRINFDCRHWIESLLTLYREPRESKDGQPLILEVRLHVRFLANPGIVHSLSTPVANVDTPGYNIWGLGWIKDCTKCHNSSWKVAAYQSRSGHTNLCLECFMTSPRVCTMDHGRVLRGPTPWPILCYPIVGDSPQELVQIPPFPECNLCWRRACPKICEQHPFRHCRCGKKFCHECIPFAFNALNACGICGVQESLVCASADIRPCELCSARCCQDCSVSGCPDCQKKSTFQWLCCKCANKNDNGLCVACHVHRYERRARNLARRSIS